MKQYHIQLSEDDIRGISAVLLPGDSGRVAKIASLADQGSSEFIVSNREFTSYRCSVRGRSVLITSSGIGGPSLAIAMEELAKIGLKTFIRVGTTGAIQKNIKTGDVIISSGAVRLDGTSTHYAPIEYPAVASIHVVNELIRAARENSIDYHVGITASSDSFYPGQERYDTYTKYVIKDFQNSLAQWQKLNVLNYEMESATLFVLANVFNLAAGAVCGVVVNRTKEEHPDDSLLREVERSVGRIGLSTVYELSS